MPSETRSDRSVGVQHHSELGTHGSGRKISSELCSYHAVVSMSLSDSAPDDSESAVVACVLCLVDVSQTLTLVPINLLLSVHTFNLDERSVRVLVRLGPETLLNR